MVIKEGLSLMQGSLIGLKRGVHIYDRFMMWS